MKNIKAYRTFFRYLDNIWNSEEHDWLGGLLGAIIGVANIFFMI